MATQVTYQYAAGDAFDTNRISPRNVCSSSLAGVKIRVREGEKIFGASRKACYSGWIKIYMTGADNLLIADDAETQEYLREHRVAIAE